MESTVENSIVGGVESMEGDSIVGGVGSTAGDSIVGAGLIVGILCFIFLTFFEDVAKLPQICVKQVVFIFSYNFFNDFLPFSSSTIMRGALVAMGCCCYLFLHRSLAVVVVVIDCCPHLFLRSLLLVVACLFFLVQ